MLTKHQELTFKVMRFAYGYLEEVPIKWNSKTQQLSVNTKRRKWVKWILGNSFVFCLWLTCVYTLATQPFLKRQNLSVINLCLLRSGFVAFTAALFGSYGVFALRHNLYSSAVNEFIQLEIKTHQKYNASLLSHNRKITNADFVMLAGQSATGLPFLIYFICILMNLDGPYWVLEDFVSKPEYRNVSSILILIVIRSCFLLPGFCETSRALNFGACGSLASFIYMKDLINTLTFRIDNTSDFFRYYAQLYILSNVLGLGFQRACFVALSGLYFFFIQTLWILVRGYGHVDPAVYLVFIMMAIPVVTGQMVLYPIISLTGELIAALPIKKLQQMKVSYSLSKSHQNKANLKRAMALQPIKFCYGSYYPMGKRFSRNVVGNMMENLLDAILMFKISG